MIIRYRLRRFVLREDDIGDYHICTLDEVRERAFISEEEYAEFEQNITSYNDYDSYYEIIRFTPTHPVTGNHTNANTNLHELVKQRG